MEVTLIEVVFAMVGMLVGMATIVGIAVGILHKAHATTRKEITESERRITERMDRMDGSSTLPF